MKVPARRYLSLLGMVALSYLAAPVFAEPVAVDAKTVVAAPDWVLGSTWYYSDGYALKVTSALTAATVFDRLDAPGQWFSRQGFLRKDLTSGTATRTSIYRTVPDQAGKSLRAGSPLTFQREYLENGKLIVHASSWSVEGRETITVPAGTFDCWIIVWRSRSLRSDWTGFERWWYSPEAQNYVRMEYKYGSDAEGSRVLMRYHIGAQVAENITALTSPAAPVVALPAPDHDMHAPAALPAPENPEGTPVMENASSLKTAPPPSAGPPTAPRHAAAPLISSAAERAENTVSPPANGGNVWHAQVASSKDESAIRKRLDKILSDDAGILTDVPSGITAANMGKRGIFYRAWIGRFGRSAGAVGLCDTLRSAGIACSVSKAARSEDQRINLSKL